jgi:hypothetical protein
MMAHTGTCVSLASQLRLAMSTLNVNRKKSAKQLSCVMINNSSPPHTIKTAALTFAIYGNIPSVNYKDGIKAYFSTI